MLIEHKGTLKMLDDIDQCVDGVGKKLLAGFRELPNFWEKVRQKELVAEFQLCSRVMLLDRCNALPPEMRTESVEAKITRQREIVEAAVFMLEQRETALGYQGLSDTLKSIGWTEAPEEWGPAPVEFIEEAARPFVYRFGDYGIVDTVPDLWEEGVTPADIPREYREVMRKEGYLPPFNEDCDVRSEWVAFFLEGGTGATDAAKWQRVFGMVPRWN